MNDCGSPLVEGSPESSVRVFIYEDLQCRDCVALRRMLDDELLPRFGAQVAFVHRDFPLPKHAYSRLAAVAARYFGSLRPELGIAWRRHALDRLGELNTENFVGELERWAAENGCDPVQTIGALQRNDLSDAVECDYQTGIAHGVRHTPTVFVNETPFVESFTAEEISEGLEKAIGG